MASLDLFMPSLASTGSEPLSSFSTANHICHALNSLKPNRHHCLTGSAQGYTYPPHRICLLGTFLKHQNHGGFMVLGFPHYNEENSSVQMVNYICPGFFHQPTAAQALKGWNELLFSQFSSKQTQRNRSVNETELAMCQKKEISIFPMENSPFGCPRHAIMAPRWIEACRKVLPGVAAIYEWHIAFKCCKD